jgi:hypothetical protein
LLLGDKALCLSAAEKEEYEAFRLFRQPLFYIVLLRHTPMNLSQLVDSVRLFLREANYIKPSSGLARGFVTIREKSSGRA